MDVDVHAWTGQMNQMLQQSFFERVEPQDWDQLIQEISICVHKNPDALSALQKMNGRYQSELGGYLDPDLQNANVASIVRHVWNHLKNIGSPELIIETLQDIGATCIQGDSHRLLFLFRMLQ